MIDPLLRGLYYIELCDGWCPNDNMASNMIGTAIKNIRVAQKYGWDRAVQNKDIRDELVRMLSAI